MGNCFCKQKHHKMSESPVVAVIGSTGYVGKFIMPVFLDSLKNGKLKELRVLTAPEKMNSEKIQSYASAGAKVMSVDYKQVSSVTTALNGVDAVVSTLGTGEGIEDVKTILLDALVAAKVKLYFPSEFGTNHYKFLNYNHPLFEGKRKHFKQAKERGLNTIRILTGDIMEATFGKWFGLDCVSGVWTLVGNAADIPCAMTAERDLGRFTVEAILLAHSDVSGCPDEIEVYSDMKTLREYAKGFDKVSGRVTKIEQVPLEEFKAEYEKSADKEFVKLLMMMFAEGAYDFSNATGNQLLNPNEAKQFKMAVPPVVAVIGSTGYVGKFVMPAFLDGLKDGKLNELRVLTVQEKLKSEQIQSYVTSGAKAMVVDFKKVSTVTTALTGVDAVVSTIGTGDGIEDVKTALLDAMVAAKVKLYFPSEFGTNHYKFLNYNHPFFDGKRKHFKQAKERGLKTIRMLTGDFMEFAFSKLLGLDCVSGVWTLVGNAADIPCAMTAERDLGRFILEAIFHGLSDVSGCPDEIEVYSDMKTLREYAKGFDKVSGRVTKIEQVPLEEFKAEYEKSADKEFVKLLMMMFAEGAYDFSNATGNQLLNPNETVWKLKKFEEYAKESGGIPWKDAEVDVNVTV
ncbi:Isoflavone reductase-like protein [Orchesella cincta]|uniref:Isoflavone reductase-like protein n=1 Tax=Orchesella cincta TaxID=48709 RepID=A0A1D2N6M4_ORCCI|nr:Isoflavone reductase-like protein [Orchesella cincta]